MVNFVTTTPKDTTHMPNSGGARKLGAWLRQVNEAWDEDARQHGDEPWSQARFCEHIKITPNGLRGWEKGTYDAPRAASLDSVADGLGVDVDTIDAVMDGRSVSIPARPRPEGSTPNDGLPGRVTDLESQVDEIQKDLRRLDRLLTDLAVAIARDR